MKFRYFIMPMKSGRCYVTISDTFASKELIDFYKSCMKEVSKFWFYMYKYWIWDRYV